VSEELSHFDEAGQARMVDAGAKVETRRDDQAVSNRREKLLLSGGVLIGFGMGLCVGVGLLFVGVAFLLHHMFIMGIQWPRFLLYAVLPLIAIASGGLILRSARRVEG